MDQKIIDLYDEYTHAPLPRRVFLERLVVLAGGAAAIPAILASIEPNYARAAVVGEDDSRLAAEKVSFQGATGDVSGYIARPKLIDKAPAVIVIHENRGLNAYVEDVTRRLATEGFVAFAPDLLSPLGGTPQDADKARDMIAQLDADKTVNNLVGAMSYLMAYRYSSGKVGAVGFCWGGGMMNRLAIKASDLKAGVAFYGPPPDPALVGTIKAPLMLHYAGLDQRLNAAVPAYDEALTKAKVEHQVFMYDGVNHAFHNDTSAERYNKEAADLAWTRSVAFLKAKLA
ncbi:dienelactone hydrolase family protein [Azospirillum doebereinerae]|uniref:Dienelactone hydrolase family protein n=1 Tax=Azospirillum doebereinerae TaxID=92933 RepID=A0A433J8Z0_9PROT|nr:dienelactone hydrolase family protein [Azospirillum doebereinerae]RUQ70820.1 dienelactone hydrolase family protein [Azospirillum doebereinerae]